MLLLKTHRNRNKSGRCTTFGRSRKREKHAGGNNIKNGKNPEKSEDVSRNIHGHPLNSTQMKNMYISYLFMVRRERLLLRRAGFALINMTFTFKYNGI